MNISNNQYMKKPFFTRFLTKNNKSLLASTNKDLL